MKKIELTQGQFALVDDEDFDGLSLTQWRYCNSSDGSQGYAYGQVLGVQIPMHRYIMVTPGHLLCDHQDGNRLNNQKWNLRNCTHSQNQMNIKRKNGKWKGVRTDSTSGKFFAEIFAKGVRYGSTRFETKKQAAEEYNRLAMIHHGEFASLNQM